MSTSALNINEILHEIFQHLKAITETRDYSGFTYDRQGLVQAALTCKAFSEPALDVLWEEMDSIEPLLQILPVFQKESGRLRLLGPVAPEGWVRLKLFAHRIRKIRFNLFPDKDGVPIIDSSVYTRLAGFTQGKSLLPSLRIMECNELSDAAFLCLSPGLRMVSIDDPNDDDEVGPFLHALADVAPSVGTLLVRSDRLIDSSLEAFTRFACLTSLTIDTRDIDRPALNILASLSCLSVLSIDLSLADSQFFQDTRHERRYFHDLRHLNIRGSASLSAEFLGCLTGTTFESLEVTDSWAVDGGDLVLLKRTADIWRGLFEELPRFSQSFQSLVVYYDCRHAHPADYYDKVQAASVLQPLFHLRNLEKLAFIADFLPMYFMDADIDGMTRAWPMMQYLKLPSTLGTIRPTAVSLASLAQFCPHVTYVQLSVDLRVLLPMPRPSMLPHFLKTLTLEMSLGGDPIFLARYLDSMFPVVHVRIWDGAMREQVEEINHVLKECQVARNNSG